MFVYQKDQKGVMLCHVQDVFTVDYIKVLKKTVKPHTYMCVYIDIHICSVSVS